MKIIFYAVNFLFHSKPNHFAFHFSNLKQSRCRLLKNNCTFLLNFTYLDIDVIANSLTTL
jgi:hypothetical protein